MAGDSWVEFAAELNQARIARGISIRAIARLVGVPSGTMQGWLNGKHRPVAALRPQYLKLADELGLADRVPDDIGGQTWDDLQPALRDRRSPYLGLRPFSVGDVDLFHGRSAEARRLAEVVRAVKDDQGHGLVVLLGASGSGKSSLLAAGLVAGECVEGVLAGWRARTVTPDADLVACAAGHDLLVIDQFEDVLLTADADRRSEVLEAVAELASATMVVIGLRSDAFARAAETSVLAEALTRPVLLAPLTRADLREIITAPAALMGVQVEEPLIRALELDLAPAPAHASVPTDVLPLLSNALLVTWAAGSGQRMSLADYESIGGAATAVESLAEGVFVSLPVEQQRAAESLLLRLVRPSAGAVTRGSVLLSELSASMQPALDAFVAARMLVVTDDRVQISHDALIAHWTRLQDWVEQSRNDLYVVDQLRSATRLWLDSGRDEQALIGVQQLPAFADWLSDPTKQHLLNSTEREYLAASDARYESMLAAEQRINRKLRRRGKLAVSLAAGTTALAMVAGVSMWVAQTAQAQAQSRQVATTAQSLRAKDPNLLTQMAVLSTSIADTREARSAVLDATSVDAPVRWAGQPSAVTASDERSGWVVRAGGTGKVTVWRTDELLSSPGTDISVDPSSSALWTVSVRQLGDRMLLAVGGKSVRALWDITGDPRLIVDVRDDDQTTYASAFSPDGSHLFFGTQAGAVSVWSLANPDQPTQVSTLQLGTDPQTNEVPAVSSLAVGTNGVVYVGGMAGSISRWRLAGGQASPMPSLATAFVPTGGSEPVAVRSLGLALSPDGTRLASGMAGRAILTWELADGRWGQPQVLRGFGSYVNAVAYSADSDQLIAGSSDQSVYIYQASTGALHRQLTGSAIITGVTFLAGRPIAAGADGAVRIWSAQGPELRPGGGAASYNLATNAESDDGWLVAGNSYASMDLWRMQSGSITQMPDPQVALPQGDVQKGAAAVAPSGKFLIGATQGGRVISWALSDAGATQPKVVETGLGYLSGAKIAPSGRLISVIEYQGDQAGVLVADDRGTLTMAAAIPAETPVSSNFSADSKILAVALAAGRVELWSVADPYHPAQVGAIDISGSTPTTLAASTTSPLLAVGENTGVVTVWNVADPAKPVKVRQYGDSSSTVYSLDFAPDGNRLVATCGDDLIWGWDLASSATEADVVLDGKFGRPWDARFIDGGRRIAVTGNNGQIKTWSASVSQAKEQLCDLRGDKLTDEEWRRFLPGVSRSDPCRA